MAHNAEGLVTNAFYHRHLVPRALQVWRRHVRTSRRLTQTQGLIRLQWKRMAMRDHLECWIEFCNHPLTNLRTETKSMWRVRDNRDADHVLVAMLLVDEGDGERTEKVDRN